MKSMLAERPGIPHEVDACDRNDILHQINPQIQPKNYCDEKFTNNNFDIGDKQAIDAAIPRGFDSTLMCASGQVVKFYYQMNA